MHFGSAAADQLFEIRCDVLTKLHQGTHSKDAFTNNLHELAYHIRCTDGTELQDRTHCAFCGRSYAQAGSEDNVHVAPLARDSAAAMPGKPIEAQLYANIEAAGGWERIWDRVANGETQTAIAEGFGISQGFLSRVIHLDPARVRAIPSTKRI